MREKIREFPKKLLHNTGVSNFKKQLITHNL